MKTLSIPTLWRRIGPEVAVANGLCLLLLMTHLTTLRQYLVLNEEFMIAAILAPFIIGVDRSKAGRLAFGVISIALLALWAVLHLHTLLYMALLAGLAFVVEQYVGRLNHGTLVLMAVSSPLATYVFKVFGFPIRLQLTQWAGGMLRLSGMDISSMGNTLEMTGASFTVEAACAGLKLVSTGLLITLMMIRREERRSGSHSRLSQLLPLLGISLLLILLTNLVRIIALIIFNAPEDSLAHEMLGLMALAVYCVLPMMWIIPAWYRRLDRSRLSRLEPESHADVLAPPLSTSVDDKGAQVYQRALPAVGLRHLMALAVMAPLMMASTYEHDTLSATSDSLIKGPEIEGFEQMPTSFEGLKYANEDRLLYIKPCDNYWRTDHNPIICWRGSGYRFSQEALSRSAEQEVFTATLRKGDDRLYTAWWYTNGVSITTSQWSWRMDMARGAAPYRLINVSCESRAELDLAIAELLYCDLTATVEMTVCHE